MPMHHLGSLRSLSSDSSVVPLEACGLEAARRGVEDDIAGDASALARTVRDQLARDIADIERASAALRKAEPALESWINTPVTTVLKPRPVWLLIGVLWLSTALVTLGAVVAISALVG
jgi:CO dehydrogenase/acetyl-CoA synthase alpha subunit